MRVVVLRRLGLRVAQIFEAALVGCDRLLVEDVAGVFDVSRLASRSEEIRRVELAARIRDELGEERETTRVAQVERRVRGDRPEVALFDERELFGGGFRDRCVS